MPYIDLNLPWVYTCSPSWTPLPPPYSSHPSGSSQCTSPEHPVSCIEPGLAIRFTYIIHVSMLFSHIIALSHRVQKTAVYLCVSFAVLHTGLSLPSFEIPYICNSIIYWCFSFWLISLCIIGSSLVSSVKLSHFMVGLVMLLKYLKISKNTANKYKLWNSDDSD